ncbi:MAG: hypothetical protein ACP5UH_01395 [Candidatus Micrarchaeia archaeon]
MRRFEILLVVSALVAMSTTASAQYWFQTGVKGSDSSAFNNGARASIETVYQNITYGSLGFWVGETLQNGAFVQVGYEIPNQSANFSTDCSLSGCTNTTYLKAGVPTWFWEYFPANYNGSQFYGNIGQNGSAGANGSFNTYSFTSIGDTWYFYFNNKLIGSADLGTSSSGANPPIAFGEYAGSESNSTRMGDVKFRNFEFYNGNAFLLVPEAYTYIGYGKGSETELPNPYGIEEVDNYVDYFEVGSGLPLQNHTELWKLGYWLNVSSPYGNLTRESGNYSAYVPVGISAPQYVYVGNDTREAFEGWRGSGIGSYTGPKENATVLMDSNITEEALWQIQYLVNITNGRGIATGSGWYNAGATAHIGAGAGYLGTGVGSRIEFEGWSNGYKSQNITVTVTGPTTISPIWRQQYLVNATAEYGSVDGNGWYNENSTVVLSLTSRNISINSNEKEAFYAWSNGSTENPLSFVASKPVFISAFYEPMYLAMLEPVDTYNNSISGVTYGISGENYSTNYAYLFAGKTYNIEYATYKGTTMAINQRVEISSPQAIVVKLPVYNVQISARSLFGTPVDARIELTFKNGTTIETSTGANGTLVLYDVPYGYASGSASEMGLSHSIEAAFGSSINLTMMTPLAATMIVVGVLAVFASVVVGEIIERRHKSAVQKAEAR